MGARGAANVIKMLWIGPELGPVERMSVCSFLAAGHPVELFTYGSVAGVPDGVTVRDGRDVLPESRIVRHSRSGSLALFSDFFRFVVLGKEGGIWADTDVICLSPLAMDEPYVFGHQDHRLINSAVYAAPPDSEFAAFMMAQSLKPARLPRWASGRSVIRILGGALLGKYRGVEDAPWGLYGPEMLTAAVRRFRLEGICQPREVFYPVGPGEASLFFGPADAVEARFSAATKAVHLWRAELGSRATSPFPERSYLASLARRFL